MTDQNSQFFAILTAVGEAKQANAAALGTSWTFAQMAVGDANGTDPIPNRTQTKLINERRRAPLNQVKVDPGNASVVIAEQIIPESVGGWWVRELALYDADGDMVAVANCAPTFKPLLAQGSGRTQVIRINLIVSSTSNIELKIDPSVVLATRAYVDELTVRANQIEAETGTNNSKIMTPLRVFQAIAKVVVQATEAAFGWAKVSTQTQVTTGTDDATIVTPKKLRGAQATQEEAEEGINNTKVMTPLRVFQAIGKVVVQATEDVFGWAKVATQIQVNAGTDDATIVTPKKFSAGLKTRMSGVMSGQYPITLGSQVVFNHNSGVIPFTVEFSFVCLAAEGGWAAGDIVHRGNWYQNSISTDNSTGIFWYGETSTQITFGLGSTNVLLPTKTTGFRFTATAANWRFVARVIG